MKFYYLGDQSFETDFNNTVFLPNNDEKASFFAQIKNEYHCYRIKIILSESNLGQVLTGTFFETILIASSQIRF